MASALVSAAPVVHYARDYTHHDPEALVSVCGGQLALALQHGCDVIENCSENFFAQGAARPMLQPHFRHALV